MRRHALRPVRDVDASCLDAAKGSESPLNILLIQPAVTGQPRRYREGRGARAARTLFNRLSDIEFGAGTRLPPFALMTLAAHCPPGTEVRIVDEWVEAVDTDTQADLVGISVMTMTASRAYEIANAFRERGIPVVLGGIHATVMPDEAAGNADAVVIGEAESVWEEVLADVAAGRLRERYEADRHCAMTGLPLPRRDLTPRDRYLSLNLVQTTRGCPNRCSFCSIHAVAGTRYRSRPVQEVVAEIATLPDPLVLFVDDNIVGNPEYARRLFEALVPLNVRWTAQATLDIVSKPGLLALARRSGCRFLLIGFESLSPASIDEIGKTASNDVADYESAIRQIHSHGIGIAGTFVFGLDTDGVDVFPRTAQFIQNNAIDVPTAGILTPYPGSRLFDELRATGRLLHADWRRYSHVTGGAVFQPARMSPCELELGYQWVGERLYALPAMVGRIARVRRNLPAVLAWDLGRRRAFYGARRSIRREAVQPMPAVQLSDTADQV